MAGLNSNRGRGMHTLALWLHASGRVAWFMAIDNPGTIFDWRFNLFVLMGLNYVERG